MDSGIREAFIRKRAGIRGDPWGSMGIRGDPWGSVGIREDPWGSVRVRIDLIVKRQ